MFSINALIQFVLTEVYSVLLLAFVFRRQLREGKRNVWLKTLLVMFALYLGQLFSTLLVPTYFFRRFAFSTARLNLVPFRALREWLAHPFNFFGNVLLFIPVGFFEVLLHPAWSRKKQLAYTAATAAMLSLFVEFAQLFNYRVSDVDDIILNTIGGVLGALLCIFQQKIGFNKTRVGKVLLPAIPRTWRRHMLLNRYFVLLVVSMEVILFTVNYIVTVPKTQVRENMAAQVAVESPAPSAEPDVTAAPAQPDTTAAPTATPVPTKVPKMYRTEGLELEAQNVLLVRLADGSSAEQVIFAYGCDESIYPASTLKMITALTVLDIADPEAEVTLGTEVYIPPLDAARAGLEYGMTLTVRELLEGLLLPSGADAAYALAVYCGRQLEGNDSLSYSDAVEAFVAVMNRKAAEIGADHTTARNVVGLDDKAQLTTAEDLLKIAKVFLAQPLLAEICRLPSDNISGEDGKTVSLSNTNKMLHSESEYFNGSVAGVKTGTTSRAGNCLISVFTTGGERYLCIVMNSSYYGKFTDTQKLFDVCAAAD